MGIWYCKARPGKKKWKVRVEINGIISQRWFETEAEGKEWEDKIKNHKFPDAVNLPSDDLQLSLIEDAQKGAMSIQSLSEKYDKSERTIREAIERLKEKNYEIEIEEHTNLAHIKAPSAMLPKAINLELNHKGQMKFLVTGDWHLGSKYQQISILKTAMKLQKKKTYVWVLLVVTYMTDTNYTAKDIFTKGFYWALMNSVIILLQMPPNQVLKITR